jgi:hypothetical protein
LSTISIYTGHAKGLSQLGGCGTRRICSSKCSLASSPCLFCRPAKGGITNAGLHRHTLTAQAAFAKIEHPLEDRQLHLINIQDFTHILHPLEADLMPSVYTLAMKNISVKQKELGIERR